MDKVFSYPGALSSFSAKIDLCFALGGITQEMRDDLNIIRDVRNKFCHTVSARSFSDPDIASKCKRLKFSAAPGTQVAAAQLMEAMAEYGPESRRQFTVAVVVLIMFIMLFYYRRVAQHRVLEANKAVIAKDAAQAFSAFSDILMSKVRDTQGSAAEA